MASVKDDVLPQVIESIEKKGNNLLIKFVDSKAANQTNQHINSFKPVTSTIEKSSVSGGSVLTVEPKKESIKETNLVLSDFLKAAKTVVKVKGFNTILAKDLFEMI